MTQRHPLLKQLLKEFNEEAYSKHLTSLNFDSPNLLGRMQDLLQEQNFAAREQNFQTLHDELSPKDTGRIANPFFLGYGNINAEILILGKELGFDASKNPELMLHESINHTAQWEFLTQNSNLSTQEALLHLGYDPRFPRSFHKQKLGTGHTWYMYAKILSKIHGINDVHAFFHETEAIEKSFFNQCFISELNHIPSKYSERRKPSSERRALLKHSFFKTFPVVLVGAPGYFTNAQFQDTFEVSLVEERMVLGDIGKKKPRKLTVDIFRSDHQIFFSCPHLSQGSGWSNEALDKLAKKIKQEGSIN